MAKIIVNVVDEETEKIKSLIFDELRELKRVIRNNGLYYDMIKKVDGQTIEEVKHNEECFRLCIHIADEIDEMIERICFNIEEIENAEEK